MGKQNHYSKLSELIEASNDTLLAQNTEAGWAVAGKALVREKEGAVLILTNLMAKPPSAKASAQELDEEDSASASPAGHRKTKDLYEITGAPTDHVLDLQYFFPYCDQFLKAGNQRSIAFVICGRHEDIERASCYLLGQSLVHPRLAIYTGDSEREVNFKSNVNIRLYPLYYPLEKIGSLFPLLRVGTSLTSENHQPVASGIPVQTLFRTALDFSRCIDSNTQPPAPRTADFQLDLLLAAGCNQITNIAKNLRGSDDEQIVPEVRSSLLRKFWERVKADIGRLPLLTQLIWLYSLRYLSEQKELMTGGEKGILHWERMDMALWDAIAYGEGILQLLENSEQHSCHHAGYFTMVFQDISLRQSAKLVKAAAKRERIFRRYRSYTTEPAFLPLETEFCLEFNVTDMAYDDQWKPNGISVCAGRPLHTLFSGDFADVDMEDADRIIHHYGMPLFHKTVRLNKGRFLCATPLEPGQIVCYYAAKGAPISLTTSSEQVWTTYRILLPVTYRVVPHAEQFNAGAPTPLFAPAFLKQRPTQYRQTYLQRPSDIVDIAQPPVSAAQIKQAGALKIARWLSMEAAQPRTIYLLDMRKLDSLEFEVYSKGLFRYFADRPHKDTSDVLLRIIFRDKFALCEFLRRAAIFYGKFGQNSWMERVQIALCIPPDGEMGDPAALARDASIWLILAGKDLSTAYATAKLFAHYSLKGANVLLPQIQYLTRVLEGPATSEVQAQPQFPFDLVEREEKPSQFLEQMEDYLNQDLQGEHLGCKLQNAHVRLGSKIHIADFYEAELLFHSIGHTYRFAYLIAEDLVSALSGLEPGEMPQQLILVGYEGYSSILVEQIAELLRLSLGTESLSSIVHMQYLREDGGTEYISPIDAVLDPDLREQTACVFILPVGTTLSTIYKIRNVLFRQYADQLGETRPPVLRSYAVIVVADGSEQNRSSDYWTEQDGLISLNQEENGTPDSDKLAVRYFLMPKTNWFAPTDCRYCGSGRGEENSLWSRPSTHIPLTQVDKTSTLPNLIFPLKKKGIRGISFSLDSEKRRKENDQRLQSLKRHIQYGHLTMGPNHFQFYIDYTAYYAQEQAKCRSWLESLRGTVDTNAFNIIVSPRSSNDCLFVKNTVDIVFQHSLRLLFLPMESVFREDIRAKFSYITQEYLTACGSDFRPQINIYYVDYTLVSGYTLQRGKSMVNMLLQDAKIQNRDNISLFHKVILLVNRSAYDTINSIVQEPEKNFMAYATLAVATFNTHQGHCPTCELVELYREISKCCATNELYWYFRGLAQKHQLRSAEEHAIWQRRFQAAHPHCLQFLCQQLYFEQEQRAAGQAALEALVKSFHSWKQQFNPSFLYEDEGQRRLTNLSLGELFPGMLDEAAPNACVQKLREDVIPQREWRRMISTHRAMLLQESMAAEGWDGAQVNGAIWGLLQTEVFSEKNLFLQREWLISYLKVLSRGYLARLAPIRKSIYILLELILMTLTAPSDFLAPESQLLEQEWRAFLPSGFHQDELDAMKRILTLHQDMAPNELLQMYQLYLTISKRLCDLQSNLLLRQEMLLRIQDFLERLKLCRRAILERCSAAQNDPAAAALTLLMPLPTNDQMRIHYVRLVKWATMSSAEESKAFPLQKMVQALVGQEDSTQILNCSKLGEVLCMENTRLVYTGVKRMDESCDCNASWPALLNHVSERRRACVKEDGEEKAYILQNPLADLFRFLDADGQVSNNQLAAMLGFYRLVKKIEDGAVLEGQKNYIEQYSSLCFYMGKIASCQNCCLVHQQNDRNQIIAQSLLKEDSEVDDLVDTILNESEHNLRENQLYNTAVLWSPTVGKNCKGANSALVLSLHIQRRRDIKRRQNIYIVLFNRNGPTLTTDQGRYILFMRQPLQQLLERDLYALHHFRLTYQDVIPLSGKGTRRPLTLLHLTDLHITVQNEDSIAKLIQEHETELKKGGPDLLVITGDIVQGNSTAIDLEKNYQAAGRIIQKIAALLWPRPDPDETSPAPRPDWRKRVVIVPGNHDYASMNELSATHFLRTTNGGTPVLKDGSPMSRFSYYIQFLQEVLHIDMSQSIRNNLNQIREYPELGVRIVALNSVSEVGPLRNNKVLLDQDFIAGLRKVPSSGDAYINVCLAHHTVCYRPDYTADQYYETGLPRSCVQTAKEIVQICRAAQERLLSTPGAWKTIKEETGKQLDALHRRTPYDQLLKKHKDSVLYSDIEYLEQHWDTPTNERCQQIFSDFQRHHEMASRDYEDYQSRLRELRTKIPLHVMLGGHTHEAGYSQGDVCTQGPRFFRKETPTQLWFGRLTILASAADGPRFIYEFHPSDITRKPLKVPKDIFD